MRRRFSAATLDRLRDLSRRLIALIRSRSLTTGLPQRATTARVYFIRLRMLLQWMIEEGFTRFADLDEVALQRYRHHVASRRGRNSRLLTPASQELSIRVLVYLHRYRAELGDGLMIDPCPGQCAHAVAGASRALGGSLPYTPDLVAAPLIQGAIDFLETSAIDILCARERYITACQRAHARGLSWDDYREQVLHAVQMGPIRLQGHSKVIDDLVELSTLISLVYSACFVVISYLVGSRVSEILALRAGCIRPMTADEIRGSGELAVILGSIFKHESGYYGRTHEWVAPPPAIHAISVLEALSEQLRETAQILLHLHASKARAFGHDVDPRAATLVQAGLTLGVCDWGFCVYRQEHSACLGSVTEPNPIYREPSTCVRCRNYVVTEQHRSYWQEQVERHQALLHDPDLPRQTLKIARDRLTEATKVLRSLTISRGRD